MNTDRAEMSESPDNALRPDYRDRRDSTSTQRYLAETRAVEACNAHGENCCAPMGTAPEIRQQQPSLPGSQTRGEPIKAEKRKIWRRNIAGICGGILGDDDIWRRPLEAAPIQVV